MLTLWKNPLISGSSDLKKSFDDVIDDSFFGPIDRVFKRIADSIVETQETDGKINYYVDVPGIKKTDLTVTQEGNMIKVHGERKQRNSKSTIDTQFTISKDCDVDSLEANLADGVLTISFTKKVQQPAQPQVKQIEIKSTE